MENFIVVAVFTYAHEYFVLKMVLDQKRIPYYFQNETMLGVLPFHSLALGGIRLLVHPNDLLEVNQIIDDLKHNKDLHIV